MTVSELIKDNPVLVIMRNVSDEIIMEYADAIMAGGIKFFEVALNSKNATEQISALKKRFGNTAFVGAGTAITVERAKAACDAGADFLLSPSTNEDVLKYCYDGGISIMPGALTPTDVSLCVRYGFNTIKLFPAGDMPMSYVKSLKGPFDCTEYVAIGGVNSENAPQFIKAGYCGIGLGTNLVPKDVLANRDFKAVSEHVARLLQSVKSAK